MSTSSFLARWQSRSRLLSISLLLLFKRWRCAPEPHAGACGAAERLRFTLVPQTNIHKPPPELIFSPHIRSIQTGKALVSRMEITHWELKRRCALTCQARICLRIFTRIPLSSACIRSSSSHPVKTRIGGCRRNWAYTACSRPVASCRALTL